MERQKKEIKMMNFTNLDSLYEHIEKRAIDYKDPLEIGDLFQKLRDLRHEENNSVEAEKAQWEIDFFYFVLAKGEIGNRFTSTTDKGEVVEYPSLSRFDNRAYEYLLKRLSNTQNPLLKAYYSHILWCSPKKHTKYAKQAVDSYLELIKIYEKKDKREPQEHYGLDVLKAIQNAYFISHQIKYKRDKIKSELRRLISRFNFKSSSSFALRANLIELMFEGKKRFTKEDFDGFENLCWRMSKDLTIAGNIHAAISMLEIGEEVDKKLSRTSHVWKRRIAESYEKLMNQTKDAASLSFCLSALENFKKANAKRKIKELEKKYSELKSSTKFTEIKKNIDIGKHLKKCREVAEKIVQKSNSEQLIKILMGDESLLPQYKDMEKIIKKRREQSITEQLFPIVPIDQSGHFSQHFSEEEEKKYYAILQQYQWELEIIKIHLINDIFVTAIRENKLSTNVILRFLNRHSWFGKTISKTLPNNKTIEYNWLNLIAPSLNEYFIQMQYCFLGSINNPNFVLSIDSLTLKIEGLLRDICCFSGVTTFYMTADKKGRRIAREKDIHALLYEDEVKKLFNENDLLFFKFLLVEKVGYNIRHKVAHSLMLFQEYNISYMHLLILALLRLGKYDFIKEKKRVSKKLKNSDK